MKIGFAMCGSFCTFSSAFEQMTLLRDAGHEIVPIMSFNASKIDTRFGKASDHVVRAEAISDRRLINTIEDAEPLGPSEKLDLLIICPCTGNTLAKLSAGITDTPVTMAAKAHLRGDGPLLIALATNDGLSANLSNINALSKRKSVYFLPMKQDDPVKKPHSLVADFERMPEAVAATLRREQLRPLFL
ncbi:MAG: dipicolinate synthase subunit B [Clostridia bacterium]|nr:dipicolinate synthase subunit B [Clostridia bacterium]